MQQEDSGHSCPLIRDRPLSIAKLASTKLLLKELHLVAVHSLVLNIQPSVPL